MKSNLIFKQSIDPESSTYTYLLGDSDSREAIIIDPVYEMAERDLAMIKDLKLNLRYILETHVHADHITGAWILKRATGAQIAMSKDANARNQDLLLHEGSLLYFGEFQVSAIETPGHTSGCMTYQLDDMLFTGDALLIQAAGRTDFQGGSATDLYESIHKIFSKPPNTKIFPAHDYKGRTHTTVADEIASNPRISGKSKQEFVEIMSNLNLPKPKKIDVAVPANQVCGNIQSLHPTEDK